VESDNQVKQAQMQAQIEVEEETADPKDEKMAMRAQVSRNLTLHHQTDLGRALDLSLGALQPPVPE
jgi:hypothetical protein